MGDRREIKRKKQKGSSSVRKVRSSKYILNSADKSYLFLQSTFYSNQLSIQNYFFRLFLGEIHVFCNVLNNISVDFLDKF